MKKLSFLSVLIIAFVSGMILYTSALSSANNGFYKKKCSRCHKLYQPNDYPREEWIRNVNRMTARANLTPAQKKAFIRLNSR